MAKVLPEQIVEAQAVRQRQLRAVIQLIFFIAMPSAFVAGFSGVKYIFTQIGTGSVLERNSFLLVLIGLAVFTILFGKYFCGYVCAFGTLGDFVYRVSGFIQEKMLKNRKRKQFSLAVSLPESCFLALQKVKYVILLLIVTGMALQERFFCQFLCPMGAVFALLPILPAAVLKRREENCRKGCSLCRKKCPVQLKLEADSLLSGECIRCGRCAAACPGENIHSFAGRLTGSEVWLVIMKAVLFFFMGTALGLCRFL